MSDCLDCDCRKKKDDIEKTCPLEKSCPDKVELAKLNTKYDNAYKNHGKGKGNTYAKGSSGEERLTNRIYLNEYAKLINGDKKKKKCAEKRKCILIKFSEGKNKCCEGMTAHHILPGSSVREKSKDKQYLKSTTKPKGENCYDHSASPTVCAAGSSNSKGRHGHFHLMLKQGIIKDRGKAPDKVKTMPLSKMIDISSAAFHEATNNTCKKECIKLSLKNNLEQMCGSDVLKQNVRGVWGKGPATKENRNHTIKAFRDAYS